MQRNRYNFVIDFATATLMGALIVTGVLLRFVLYAGNHEQMQLWGWHRPQLADLHFYIAASLVTVLFVHMASHWHWIFATAWRSIIGRTRALPRRFAANVVGIAVAIALCLGLGVFSLAAGVAVHDARFENDAQLAPGSESTASTEIAEHYPF